MTDAASGPQLTVVGTGIQLLAQIPAATRYEIEAADKLLHVVADSITADWLKGLNDSAESMLGLYQEGESRIGAYEAMVEATLASLRGGARTCVAYYGHPGVFCYPGHEAIRLARLEGFPAVMLPAISAEDCLVADLGFDPGLLGCQSYEATDFILSERIFDPTVPLILWQPGVIGDFTPNSKPNRAAREYLVRRLVEHYGKGHGVLEYEAAQFPVCGPRMDWIALEDLSEVELNGITTLFIPPLAPRGPSEEVMKELGLKGKLRGWVDGNSLPWWRSVDQPGHAAGRNERTNLERA